MTGKSVWAAVQQTKEKAYYLFDGYAHLAAGLACGLAGLAAGMAIGIVGDAGVRYACLLPLLLLLGTCYLCILFVSNLMNSRCFRANAQQPKLFVGMILILIFAEALALYGLIGTSPGFQLAAMAARHLCSPCLHLSTLLPILHFIFTNSAGHTSTRKAFILTRTFCYQKDCISVNMMLCSWHHPCIQGWAGRPRLMGRADCPTSRPARHC